MRKQITAVNTVRHPPGFSSCLGIKSHINEQRIRSYSGSNQRFAFFLTGRIFQPNLIAVFDAFFTGRLQGGSTPRYPASAHSAVVHIASRTVGMHRNFS